jgi:Asp/Glu/hydantoin racemase
MSKTRIALIHATPVAIGPIQEEFAQSWPQALTTNLLDDSLSQDLADVGVLNDALLNRFSILTDYAHKSSANAVLFTCSAFGPAIEAAQKVVPIPVLKPNQAMVEEALSISPRIVLMTTFEPAARPMQVEIEEMAVQKNISLLLDVVMVPAALKALQAGDKLEHDRLIAEAAANCKGGDVIMLGQFSMASAAAAVAATGKRVLTSPASAVALLKRLLR